MSADVKGDAYEGLLERNAQDVKGGAGQYFTPRALIQAIVDCVQPGARRGHRRPRLRHGRLPARRPRLRRQPLQARPGGQKRHLRFDALRGVELVAGVSRLCAMNLFLHGIGPDDDSREPPIRTDDALRDEPGEHFDVVVTNPPFGKKSSITVVNEEGETDRETLTYNRPDFWTTTSNKQLNFVQHVKSLLKIHGRAAVVVPDNVLFEGGAGEKVRRKLLHECDVHTLLRLPTGIFYAQGVKANVLFFDRKPGAKEPWTKKLWVYDLRTNKHFTLKTKRMTRADLDEFVACYQPGDAAPAQGHVVREEPRGPLARVQLRRDRRPRQGEPRPVLAQGREPGGQREPARPARPRPGDCRRPALRPRPDRGHPGRPGAAGGSARSGAPPAISVLTSARGLSHSASTFDVRPTWEMQDMALVRKLGQPSDALADHAAVIDGGVSV